jgi:hypothetical protein
MLCEIRLVRRARRQANGSIVAGIPRMDSIPWHQPAEARECVHIFASTLLDTTCK